MSKLTKVDLWLIGKVGQLGKWMGRHDRRVGRHRTDSGHLSTMQKIITAQNSWGYRPVAFSR